MKKLGFGVMRLPIINGDNKNIDLEAFREMADAYLAEGFTYFDTAYPYHGGNSEIAIKEAVVKRYPRENFTITDKMPMFSVTKAEQLESIFAEQLEKCGVDYFDYYLLHALGSETFRRSEELGAFNFISRKKSEGKIRNIGFSFHDKAAVLDEILTAHPEVDVVQLQLNYLDMEDESIQGQKCLETALKHGKDIIVMEPVKGGALANIPKEATKLFKGYSESASPASWAIRFAATLPGVIMVLSGMSNMKQLCDNMSYMKIFSPLNEEESEIIGKVAEIIRNAPAIACTACKYCVDGCPAGIPIPDYFSVYNNLKRYPSQKIVCETYYENLAAKHASPAECVGCGACEKACPQHLGIVKLLQKVKKELGE